MKGWICSSLLGVALVLMSCSDRGVVPEYIEVLSTQPAPNETQVDKGRFIQIALSRPVHVSEAGKIQLRYVDDTSSINNITYCGFTPEEVEHLCAGPFIWKPGRTVEVTLPRTIADPEGRTLRRDFVYRFTIARDTIPFRLVSSVPADGDTISLGTSSYVGGMLTFTDYTFIDQGVLSITSPARICTSAFIVVDGRETPRSDVHFSMTDLSPGGTYEILIPTRISDYEGETLPHEYRIVFHTR